MMSNAGTEVGDDGVCNYNSIQLYCIQQGAKFLPTLSNDMQPLAGSQQLEFIRRELGMSISKLTLIT